MSSSPSSSSTIGTSCIIEPVFGFLAVDGVATLATVLERVGRSEPPTNFVAEELEEEEDADLAVETFAAGFLVADTPPLTDDPLGSFAADPPADDDVVSFAFTLERGAGLTLLLRTLGAEASSSIGTSDDDAAADDEYVTLVDKDSGKGVVSSVNAVMRSSNRNIVWWLIEVGVSIHRVSRSLGRSTRSAGGFPATYFLSDLHHLLQ
jgi:hypothetical protein